MNDNFISVTWSEVRDDFYKLNSELAEIIDELSPTKAFRLYKARYPFGSEYVQLGKFFLPNENGDLVSLTSHTVPQQVRDDLSYNLGSHPVSFILNKSVEIYMPLPNRTTPVPHALVPKGYIFSTSVVLQEGHQLHHPAFLWSISAGSRSIFMLPKISKTKNYRRMQYKYGYNAVPPGNSFKHWDLFKDLYQHKLLGEWNLEIIFFSKKWFDHLQEKKFFKFKSYMSKKLHMAAGFWTSQHVWNTYFSLINNLSGIRPNPYAYDTAKHILLLSMGILPGMAPSDNNDAAPIQAIQNIFQNDYKLDKYLPIVMQLKTFNPYSPSKPIYYSLNYPNATELSPRSTDYASTILELYEVKSLINLYLRKIQSNELNISNTVMSDIPKLVNFDFFHSDPKAYRDIRSSNDLFQEDPQFLQTLIDSPDTGEQEHPTISSFVRGCVRISYKNQES